MFKFSQVWLRISSWYLVDILKMKFDQDLCKNLWHDLRKYPWYTELVFHFGSGGAVEKPPCKCAQIWIVPDGLCCLYELGDKTRPTQQGNMLSESMPFTFAEANELNIILMNLFCIHYVQIFSIYSFKLSFWCKSFVTQIALVEETIRMVFLFPLKHQSGSENAKGQTCSIVAMVYFVIFEKLKSSNPTTDNFK